MAGVVPIIYFFPERDGAVVVLLDGTLVVTEPSVSEILRKCTHLIRVRCRRRCRRVLMTTVALGSETDINKNLKKNDRGE